MIGASLQASASREQMSYTVDVLKTHLPEATELLLDAALNPKFELHTLKSVVAKLKTDVTALQDDAPAQLMEALHAAAFEGGLGNPLVGTPAALDALTPDSLAQFVAENFTPPRLALAAAGASLSQLAAVAEPLLSSLPPGAPAPTQADGVYVGGESRLRLGSAAGEAHIGLAFHFSGGWRDVPGATAVSVLQVLLGGGSSFSSGGPGKGLYSRLYSRVLNRHAWAHSCTAFHSLYNDSGIVGITASCPSARAGDMADVLCSELLAVASGNVSAAELERAKSATVSAVLMNLESRAVIAEDIGRQALTYGQRKAPAEFIAEVRKLTTAELAKVAARMLKSAPTFVVIGEASGLPRYDSLAKRF